jgi:hypothetical protein
MTDEPNRGAGAPPPAAAPRSLESLMNFARGAKGIALAGFLLPWVTVSCAGTPLIRMSGVDLATGSVSPIANPAAAMGGGRGGPDLSALTRGAEPDIFVILAAVLVIAGLVLTFVLPRRTAALAAMATAAAAIAIAAFDVFVRIKGAVLAGLRQGSATAPGGSTPDSEMQQFAQMISVQASVGFWITVAALVAAIVLLKMVHGRPAVATGP